MRYTFRKNERLKSEKQIEALFLKGQRATAFPLRMVYMKNPGGQTTQIAISVPKKNFKKAVDRNRIKRKTREAYRLEKPLLANNSEGFALLFLYISKQEEDYAKIRQAMGELLKKL
jgi:ribonuclease P protein component